MKRFFTLCAATIAMLLCSVTVSAKTLGTGGYGSLVWIMSDDGELIVTGNGEMLSANTESEYPWYEYRDQIESIVIGSGVTSIGDQAFFYCSNLTDVTIPASVTSIGNWAFYDCSSLAAITIPASVTSIGSLAFYGCSSLTAITIPASVTSIGDQAFEGCSSLTAITIPASVTSIGYYAFSGCSSLTNITIPASVTSIGDQAFEGCSSLTAITIPASVTSIGYYAFSGCSSLTTILVDENNEVYDSRNDCNAIIETSSNTLIAGCSTTVIPASVTSIGSLAFSGCSNLTAITIPEGVTSIGSDAFSGCSSLTAITIPERVTSIGSGAFSGCSSLTTILVDENNEVYDSRNDCNAIIETSSNVLIAGCSTTVIPEGVTSIGSWAFLGCSSLAAITLPESVTSIGDFAFEGCNNLTDINIPESVTRIGWQAFSSTAWYYNQPDGVLYLDKWVLGYKGEMPSNTSLVINEGAKGLADHAFDGCYNLTDINIPASVTSIGDYAFRGCHGFTAIALHEGLTRIGSCAFVDCSSLTTITLPTSVTSIEDQAFNGCSGLTDINIPESVTSIGDYTFSGCSSLTDINIPESVTSIGNLVFQGCSSLTDISIPESVTSIGYYAFSGCSSLTAISIPESVTSIGDYAFYQCSSLTAISIPEGVTSIGWDAFTGCSSLTAITCLMATPPSLNLDDVDKAACALTIPGTSAELYRNTWPWNEFTQVASLYKVTFVLDDEVVETRWEAEGTAVTLPNMEKEGYTFGGWRLNTPIDIKGRMSDEDMKNPQGSVLYTNAHCTNTQYNDAFTSWEVLFDGNANSIFHSEYSDIESLDGLDHYLRVDAGKAIRDFSFTYTVRGNDSSYTPSEIVVEGANEPNGTYTEIAVLTDLPGEMAAVYESPILSNGNAYRYIRFRVTKTLYNRTVHNHPYFYFAEFGMSEYKRQVIESFAMPARNVVVNGEYIKNYTVTFEYFDGTLSAELPYGAAITGPEVPEREHYTFVEWSGCPETMPAHDVVATAKYALELDESEARDFYKSADEEMARITYTRNFADAEWQTLYVPFEITVSEVLLEDFEIADLNDIRQYDYDNDGVKDETVLEAFKVTSGVLEANYPYLIRAKEQGEKVITIEEEAVVFATEENNFDCSSLREKYTFTGNYGSIGSGWPVDEGYYTLVDGAWQPVSDNTELGAFRFYLKVDSRDGSSATFARSIRLRIVGENGEDEGTTGIDSSVLEAQGSQLVYDLQGRRVENPTKGIYIVNGKKVISK